MNTIQKELQTLQTIRRAFENISDGNLEAANILIYIKENYKQWQEMLIWIKRNELTGQKLVDFFKNESDESGGGYLLGCTMILSRIKGHKNTLVGIKYDELH